MPADTTGCYLFLHFGKLALQNSYHLGTTRRRRTTTTIKLTVQVPSHLVRRGVSSFCSAADRAVCTANLNTQNLYAAGENNIQPEWTWNFSWNNKHHCASLERAEC